MLIAALLVAAAATASPAAATSASPPPPAAVAVGAPAPPDGTYVYSIQQTGAEIGTSTVKIGRADIGITVHENESLHSSYMFVTDEIFDPATLAPRAFTGVYSRGTTSSTVHVAVDRDGATVTIEGTSGTAPFPNPPGVKNVYLLEGTLVSGFAMLPAQIHASKAAQFSLVAPRSVVQAVVRIDPHPLAARPEGVPAGDALLSVTGKAHFDLWYDPATFVLHAVSVPDQQVLIQLKT